MKVIKKITPKKRLLLYVDILGFREKVKDPDAATNVYKMIDKCLKASSEIIKYDEEFGTIYFSDTILFYSKEGGFTQSRLKKLCGIATEIFNELLGNDVPISGAITYGPFYIRRKTDSTGAVIQDADPRLYFGQPLIEAYDVAKSEKWLGILVCPSVTTEFGPEELKTIDKTFWLPRKDSHGLYLLLNPYSYIERFFQTNVMASPVKKIRPLINPESELESLQFLVSSVRRYSKRGEFSTAPAYRYHATLAFVRWCLSEDAFDWATSTDTTGDSLVSSRLRT